MKMGRIIIKKDITSGDIKSTWELEVFKTIIQETDAKTKKVTLQQIYTHQDDMVKKLGSIGITPDATIRATLQNLRNFGLLQFLSTEGESGIYRLKSANLVPVVLKMLSKRRRSKGEMMIAMILDSLGIKYETEKTFLDLKRKGFLRFDFYFEKDGRGFLIEFDGEQHRKPVEFLGGNTAFIKTVESDKMKNNYAKNKDLILIRIKKLNEEKARKMIVSAITNPDKIRRKIIINKSDFVRVIDFGHLVI